MNKHPENNFDALRIFAALLVLFSHQFALSGLPEPEVFPSTSFGSLGVGIFFSISGYLVAQSWLNDPYILRFMLRRFLRIWPGLAVVTVIAALMVGPVVTTLPLWDYFDDPQTWRFFKTLILNLQFFLPGVFADNPYPNAVNGSLWTIPLEVKWYFILLIGGVLRLLQFKWLIVGIMLLLAFYHFGIYQSETNPIPHHSHRYGLYFIYGTCMCLFHKTWINKKIITVLCALILSGIAGLLHHPAIALWLAIPCLVIVFGNASTAVLRRAGRFGDVSYGIYIYAFLVQQVIIGLNADRYSFWACLSLELVVVVGLAFVSWHCVEKPALRLKNLIRQPILLTQVDRVAGITS